MSRRREETNRLDPKLVWRFFEEESNDSPVSKRENRRSSRREFACWSSGALKSVEQSSAYVAISRVICSARGRNFLLRIIDYIHRNNESDWRIQSIELSSESNDLHVVYLSLEMETHLRAPVRRAEFSASVGSESSVERDSLAFHCDNTFLIDTTKRCDDC